MTTFRSFRKRAISPNQLIKVYRNLNKRAGGKKWYSIKDAETGLVLGHSEGMLIADARFEVSEAGRQRVIKTGKKNVHSYVTGKYAGPGLGMSGQRVTYDPYSGPFFVDEKSNRVTSAEFVVINKEGVFVSDGWL